MTQIRSAQTMSPAMESAHSYHDWVFSSFAKYLRPGRVLEVGSGHGRYARKMAPMADVLVVSDIDPVAIDAIRTDLADFSNIEYLVMPGIDPRRLERPVDNIVLVNVLEHIEDDRGTLQSCRSALKRDGHLIVFVPAFEFLFSRMDQEAGHYRRYSRRDLDEKLRAAGFRILVMRYFNAVGFFGWYANKLTRSSLGGAGTNLQIRAYDKIIRLAKYVDPMLPLFGQSLLAIASPVLRS